MTQGINQNTADGKGAERTIQSGFGMSGVALNRNMAAANTTYGASTNRRTWTEAEDVHEVTVSVHSSTGAAAIQGDEYCRVALNLPSAIAASVLGDAGTGASKQVLYDAVHVGQTLTLQRTEKITSIDVLPINANMVVHVAAVGGL